MKKLLVEGWRQIPHSYAMVDQQQCLEFMNNSSIDLFHRDMPFFQSHWKPSVNLFSTEKEAMLSSMQAVPADEHWHCDAVYRVFCPFDFTPSPFGRTFVFITSEFGCVPDGVILPPELLDDKITVDSVSLITSSEWSKSGLLNSGVPAGKVYVVPLGFDPTIFFPASDHLRAGLRQQMGLADNFVFLHISAMTGNKGIRLILNSFVTIVRKYPYARLLLKGLDNLYNSHDQLLSFFCSYLTPEDVELIADKVNYVGSTMSDREVASLYQAADAYLSPYFAEGFNLPVLEAAACGLPLICTCGGSTDDFTTEDFALRIDAKIETHTSNTERTKLLLRPSFSHLCELMERVIKDDEWRSRARVQGPLYVKERYTWKHITNQLLQIMFPDLY